MIILAYEKKKWKKDERSIQEYTIQKAHLIKGAEC